MARKHPLKTGTENVIDASSLFGAGVVNNAALAASGLDAAKFTTGTLDEARLAGITAARLAGGITYSLLSLSSGDIPQSKIAASSGGGDFATRSYALSVAKGIRDVKDAAKYGLFVEIGVGAGQWGFAAGVLTAVTNGALTLQDTDAAAPITPTAGTRLAVFACTDDADPITTKVDHACVGLYDVTTAGDGSTAAVLTRSADADEDAEVTQGMHFRIIEGDQLGGSEYTLTTADPLTLNTTSLHLAQDGGGGGSYTNGNGLNLSGSTFSVKPKATTGGILVDTDGVSVRTDADSLEVDGATNNLRIKAAGVHATALNSDVAGDGIGFDGGGALTTALDGSTLSKSASGLKVADAGITATQLATGVAGNGLTGGAGTALAVGGSTSITVNADDIAVTVDPDSANPLSAGGSGLVVRAVGAADAGADTGGNTGYMTAVQARNVNQGGNVYRNTGNTTNSGTLNLLGVAVPDNSVATVEVTHHFTLTAAPAWGSGVTYAAGDIVQGSDAAYYVALQASTASDPAGGGNPSDWDPTNINRSGARVVKAAYRKGASGATPTLLGDELADTFVSAADAYLLGSTSLALNLTADTINHVLSGVQNTLNYTVKHTITSRILATTFV